MVIIRILECMEIQSKDKEEISNLKIIIWENILNVMVMKKKYFIDP